MIQDKLPQAQITRYDRSPDNPRKLYPGEYGVWNAMRDRCANPNRKGYRYYGGKGVKVCERWNSFDNFMADMGPRPGPSWEIDRKDSSKDYEPGNCHWVPGRRPQNNNKGDNVPFTHDGETHTMSEWAHILGRNPATLNTRRRAGWTDAQILGFDPPPPMVKIANRPQAVIARSTKRGQCNVKFTLTRDGVTHSLAEWARITGQPYGSVREKLKKGWDVERILTPNSSPRWR